MTTRNTLAGPAEPDWARLAIAGSSVELRCDEFFAPDLAIPTDYEGPRFVAIAFGERVAVQCGTSPGAVTAVSPIIAASIVAAAHDAHNAPLIPPGSDTATGRTVTELRLRVDDARGERLLSDVHVNHCVSRALSPAWSHFLRVMRDACGPLSQPLEYAWSHALRWAAPIDLGPPWTAGHVVPIPHRWTSIHLTGPIYLRTGQSPATSELYRIDLAGPRLELLRDRHTTELPIRYATALALPCGAAELVIHPAWQSDPRLEIRVLDATRWPYVQRA
jgi:hypothetical protein